MGKQYRIRVYGRQRKNIDPHRLAQVLILLGRHLYEQQQPHRRTIPNDVPGADGTAPEPEAGQTDGQ